MRYEKLTVTPKRVMAIYAHPDDVDVACGATLAKWVRDGTEVYLVVCTRGEKGTMDPSRSDDDVASLREEETSTASSLVGVKETFLLGLRDGELANDDRLRGDLVGFVRKIRPEVVLAPDPTAVFFSDHYFNHRDHRELGWAVLDAVFPAAGLPKYFPERGASHVISAALLSGTLEPDVFVDVGGTIDIKVEAVLAHRSQLGNDLDAARAAIRGMAGETGKRCGVSYAEAFRVVGSLSLS